MFIYYILFSLPIFPAFLYAKYKKDKYRQTTISLFFLSLLIILSLRSLTVGIDLKNYNYYFYKIQNTDWENLSKIDLEMGYIILNKIIGSISDNFQFFLFIVALITVIPMYILYTKESELPFLSIILFSNMPIFVMLFSGLRQSIAISIGTIAYYFVKNKKLVFFILCVLLAMSFHISAFILFILYPIYHWRINKKHLLIILPSIVLIFIFNNEVFKFLLGFIFKKYIERYSVFNNTGAYSMLVLFLLFLLFSYIMVNDKQIDPVTMGFRNITIIIVIIQLFAPIHALAMRFNYYLIIYLPLLISKVISRPKAELKNIAQLAHIVIVIFFTGYFFINAYTGEDILQVFPYKFFWN